MTLAHVQPARAIPCRTKCLQHATDATPSDHAHATTGAATTLRGLLKLGMLSAERAFAASEGVHRPSPANGIPQGDFMTWTTPQATDFRFGFEITMYVAAR
ncbi:pyrroloquinoline quinone precursor peptide PqqA [Variovorax sp. PDC80]|uniref:pyrroloquinoline quinone precursor peptide PqqA n=1 Tax=Variovorax sp. PDC80 TaxID=1882827 RepID=UPI001C433768|nr:pyrroloquinoline quinone precursor peptide PqqA [Variovorax sp. PDC80]